MELLETLLPILMEALSLDTAKNVLIVVGFLRVVNKPLFSLLRAYVEHTKTKEDDAKLDSLEKSKGYKIFLYLLDWFGSVKSLKK